MSTLDSILTHTDEKEQNEFQIVVFDCDLQEDDSIYITEVKNTFAQQIEQGLIHIVKTSKNDYTFLNKNLLPNLDDLPKWLYWRSKQCLDVSLIMAYCAARSQYYLHLEDDVICTDHFYPKMMNDIKPLTDEQWCAVKFCEIGFIGLLFQNTELNKLSTFIKCLFDEMPIDWLIENHYFSIKAVNGKKCIQISRSLFQHIGYYSSLTGKIQGLQSASFEAIFDMEFFKRNENFFDFLDSKIEEKGKLIKINNQLSFLQKLRNSMKIKIEK
ncbi:MAG: hypothetical protein DRR16_27750, partial [Candidatus Parabeggiatoa sp. nov. 3]